MRAMGESSLASGDLSTNEPPRDMLMRLAATPEFARAGVVLLYAAMRTELSVDGLADLAWEAGLDVALPRVDWSRRTMEAALVPRGRWSQLAIGPKGIREPLADWAAMEVSRIGWAAIPGLAFDASGDRLGRGAGFYDRFLADFRGFSVGIGFEHQLVERVPIEAHDVRVNVIATPSRYVRC
jgi:5-formyltetrahydrofolate cyclo-ligase